MRRSLVLREGVAEDGGSDNGGEGDEAENFVHKVVTPTNLVLTEIEFRRKVRLCGSAR